jgi:1,4-alpha-glucan branching enzyme
MAKTEKKRPEPKLALIQDDPWLAPYEEDLTDRLDRFQTRKAEIEKVHGSLENFASAYQDFGIHYDAENKGWRYREWAPGAKSLSLMGDFNGWDRHSHPLQKLEGGIWEVFISDAEANGLGHESLVKVHIVGDNGAKDRIPAYIQRTVQDTKTADFSGQIWAPAETFTWTDQDFAFAADAAPVIYECHVGLAQEKEGVGTFREFADEVLPRIHKLGYNAIQTMAIQEHPYYGSFGYHVSNFFATSSRFGTPEDLKYLVNKAHSLGIAVIMDIVHSHAVKNLAEGLNEFDGSGDQYFHPGGRGEHIGWDSQTL